MHDLWDAIRYLDFVLASILVARMARVMYRPRIQQSPGFGLRMLALLLAVISTSGLRVARLNQPPDWHLAVDTVMLLCALVGVWLVEDDPAPSDAERRLRGS